MKYILKTLLLAMTVALISSCEKYAEGGLIGKADKNLSASEWKLDRYYRNGNDETALLLIANFRERFLDDGSVIRNYTDKDGEPFSETGSWQFDSGNNQINLTGIGSIEFTDETSTVSSSDYNIIRLKKKELWYYYDNGGSRHELRFVPNE